MRVAIWDAGAQTDVLDEVVHHCVNRGWTRHSRSTGLVRLSNRNMTRVISCLPFGALKGRVVLFEGVVSTGIENRTL